MDVYSYKANLVKCYYIVVNYKSMAYINVKLCGHSQPDDCSYQPEVSEELRMSDNPVKQPTVKADKLLALVLTCGGNMHMHTVWNTAID